MTIEALIPSLRELSRADKLRAIQFLAAELEEDEELLLKPGVEYAIWSPYDSAGAAQVMLEMLEERKKSKNE